MPSFHSSFWFLTAALAAVMAINAGTLAAAEKLKVLIIDGQNNHPWQVMTPMMKAELEKTGRFTVDVATTPPRNAAKEDWARFRPEFAKYDVVLSNYNDYGNGDSWPEEVQDALAKYVGNGGASSSFMPPITRSLNGGNGTG